MPQLQQERQQTKKKEQEEAQQQLDCSVLITQWHDEEPFLSLDDSSLIMRKVNNDERIVRVRENKNRLKKIINFMLLQRRVELSGGKRRRAKGTKSISLIMMRVTFALLSSLSIASLSLSFFHVDWTLDLLPKYFLSEIRLKPHKFQELFFIILPLPLCAL